MILILSPYSDSTQQALLGVSSLLDTDSWSTSGLDTDSWSTPRLDAGWDSLARRFITVLGSASFLPYGLGSALLLFNCSDLFLQLLGEWSQKVVSLIFSSSWNLKRRRPYTLFRLQLNGQNSISWSFVPQTTIYRFESLEMVLRLKVIKYIVRNQFMQKKAPGGSPPNTLTLSREKVINEVRRREFQPFLRLVIIRLEETS